jgi:hypothetical protein
MEARRTVFPNVTVVEKDGSSHPLVISSWEEFEWLSDYLEDEHIEAWHRNQQERH